MNRLSLILIMVAIVVFGFALISFFTSPVAYSPSRSVTSFDYYFDNISPYLSDISDEALIEIIFRGINLLTPVVRNQLPPFISADVLTIARGYPEGGDIVNQLSESQQQASLTLINTILSNTQVLASPYPIRTTDPIYYYNPPSPSPYKKGCPNSSHVCCLPKPEIPPVFYLGACRVACNPNEDQVDINICFYRINSE